LKAGAGAGNFLGDLANGISDAEMRLRWQRGDYGKLRPDYVKQWRQFHGRA